MRCLLVGTKRKWRSFTARRRVVLGMTLADLLALGIAEHNKHCQEAGTSKACSPSDPPLFPIKLGSPTASTAARPYRTQMHESSARVPEREHKGNRLCICCKANHAATYDSPYARWRQLPKPPETRSGYHAKTSSQQTMLRIQRRPIWPTRRRRWYGYRVSSHMFQDGLTVDEHNGPHAAGEAYRLSMALDQGDMRLIAIRLETLLAELGGQHAEEPPTCA